LVNKFNAPNVFIIGFSKCGTTSLHDYFSHHPDIYVPSKKELHYHSYTSLKYLIGGPGDRYIVKDICQNEDEYLSYYKNATATSVKVDISPSYAFFPSSISSMLSLAGEEAKIICLVKHPVDKIVSQYTHLLSAGRESLSLLDALNQEKDRKDKNFSDMWLYRESGNMSCKIKEFKKNFQNVFVVNSEDLYKKGKQTLQKIFDFINVDNSKIESYNLSVKNFSGVPKSRLISKIFIQPNSFTNALRKVVPQKLGKYVREKINNLNKGEKYKVHAYLYAQLEKEYFHEIKELNGLIDTDTKIGYKYN
jgi:hypothetical protein